MLGLFPTRIHMTARVRDITYRVLRRLRPADAAKTAAGGSEPR